MKNSNLSIVVGAIALVAILASDATAQRRGGFARMMGAGGGQLHSELLIMEKVQEELKFTDEQKEKIVVAATEINDTWRSESRAIMREGGDQDEVNQLLKELQEEEQELVAQLNDDQKKRLTQLMYQRMGNGMFQNEKVAEALSLSDEQKKEIDAAFEKSQEAMQKAMEEARESGDFQAIRTAMEEVHKELAESLMGTLNDDQKKTVEELKGEAFEFPEPERRGRGGRRDF